MTEPAANPQAMTEEMVEAATWALCELAGGGGRGVCSQDCVCPKEARVALTAALSLSRPAADRGQIVEECARAVKARADFWNKQARADFMWTCSESLADECEDIYSAIRALAPAQTEE